MEVRKRYVVLIGVLRIRIIPASGLSLLLCWLRVTIRVMWLMTGSCNLRCIFRRKRDFTPTHALGNALPCMDTVGVVFGEFIPVGYSFDNGVAYEPRTVIGPAARSPVEFMHIW